MAGRFPLLTDEHVPWSLVLALRQRGWTVARVVDLKPELGEGAEDEQVFAYAIRQGHVVLSSDERGPGGPGATASRDGRSPACCAGLSATATA